MDYIKCNNGPPYSYPSLFAEQGSCGGMSHEFGLEHIQLKMLAESLNIQPPSLYNHISGQ